MRHPLSSRHRPYGLGLALAVLVMLGGLPRAVDAAPPRAIVADGVPADNLPRVASTRTVEFRVLMKPSHADQLAILLAEQRTPRSPLYQRYLAKGEFDRLFGPRPDDIDAIRQSFATFGVELRRSANALVWRARGDARHVEQLFSTTLHVAGRGGDALLVATTPVTLPANLATHIAGVVGLSRRAHAHHHVQALPRTSNSPLTSCASANASSGLSASQQASLYGIDQMWSTGVRGAGHSIALYQLARYRSSDIAAYFSCYGISPTVTNTNVDGGAYGYDAEVALDIEQAGVLAPGATLAVYSAPNDATGPVDLFSRIAADNTSDIVSISWGICELATDASAEVGIFQQMAAQGQTVFAAAGDSGSSDCQPFDSTTTPSVDDPAIQPYVTAVGGTNVTSFSPFAEEVWNDGAGAGGGGVSTVFSRPAWQSAPGMDNGSMREIPDISVTGDPRVGFPTLYNGRWATYGGTSIGAPILSALIANAAESCGVSRIGFLNPMLYAMATRGVGFRDVTRGSNDLYGVGVYDAAVGYDMASGLGSPNPTSFAAALCPSQPSSSTSVVTSTSAAIDQIATVDIALRDESGSLLPTTIPAVSVVQSGATPAVTVLPPVASGTTQRVTVTTDRPGTATVSVSVGGVPITSGTITFTPPFSKRSIGTLVAGLNGVGELRASLLNGSVVIAAQRTNHRVVLGSSANPTLVRDLTSLTRTPLASASPDSDCYRSLCATTFRSGTRVVVISNIWSAQPKAVTLPTTISNIGQPRVKILQSGSVVSYVASNGRLVMTFLSDSGSVTRTNSVGSQLRGTPVVARTAGGRARVLVRNLNTVQAFTNTTGSTITTRTVGGAVTDPANGPYVLSTSPEVVAFVASGSLELTDGTWLDDVSGPVTTLTGTTSGLLLTSRDSTTDLWALTPTWRSLDLASSLGVTSSTLSILGSGSVVIVSDGTSTWALWR